jgi:hypothetical protein
MFQATASQYLSIASSAVQGKAVDRPKGVVYTAGPTAGPNPNLPEITQPDAERYALFVAHCLCTEASVPLPIRFGELARSYCKGTGFNEELSGVSSLLEAYKNGAIRQFMELMTESETPDLADRAEELLEDLVMPGQKRAEPGKGAKIVMPRFEHIEAACLRAGLAKGRPAGSRWELLAKDEAQWRRLAGQRVEFQGYSMRGMRGRDSRGATGPVITVKLPEGNITGGTMDLGADVLCERVLDFAVKEPIATALSTALLMDPPSNEDAVFEGLLNDEADGEDLHGAVHVIRLYDAIQRLGLHDHPAVLEKKKLVALRYLMQQAWTVDGTPFLAALRKCLFIGVCLDASDMPTFEAAAEAYRQLRGLPEYWNVEAMATAYSATGESRQVWVKAEEIISGDPDPSALAALLERSRFSMLS